MSATAIRDLLHSSRLTWRTETELQLGIAHALETAGIGYRREVPLTGADRIDFLIARTGLEIKVKGSTPAVARQLQRYAHAPEIDELILASTRPHHADLPTEIASTPVTVVIMRGGAW